MVLYPENKCNDSKKNRSFNEFVQKNVLGLKPINFTIQIEAFDNASVDCLVYNPVEENRLVYPIGGGVILFEKESQMAVIIRNNRHQFEKVMRSALKGKLRVGQIIRCVFIEGFKFLKEEDFSRFILLDMREGKLDIVTGDTGTGGIYKIYADGSFVNDTNQAGYGGFIEAPDGQQEIFSRSFDQGSSNLMELLAVTEGLQRLREIKQIQVNTDSRFVIRGLVQWVHFWRHNNWQTAYGRDVRYAKQWQQACLLCEDKFVEFKWIKGHSGDLKQNFCHQLAKESSGGNLPSVK